MSQASQWPWALGHLATDIVGCNAAVSACEKDGGSPGPLPRSRSALPLNRGTTRCREARFLHVFYFSSSGSSQTSQQFSFPPIGVKVEMLRTMSCFRLFGCGSKSNCGKLQVFGLCCFPGTGICRFVYQLLSHSFVAICGLSLVETLWIFRIGPRKGENHLVRRVQQQPCLGWHFKGSQEMKLTIGACYFMDPVLVDLQRETSQKRQLTILWPMLSCANICWEPNLPGNEPNLPETHHPNLWSFNLAGNPPNATHQKPTAEELATLLPLSCPSWVGWVGII